MTGNFGIWQPKYAAQGVATFPIKIIGNDKVPAIKGWQKTGFRYSNQLAIDFGGFDSFGFGCGPRSGITVIDMDDTDESIVAEGERLFGSSPVLWRTGGGKFAMPFRHNGERRVIRAFGKSGLPIDLLGGGFVVAPGSAGARRPYEFIRGGVADFARLPHARIPDEIANSNTPLPTSLPARIPEGRREDELLKFCHRICDRYSDNLEALVDAATTFRDNRLELLPAISDDRVRRTCESVWNYRGGRKRMMGSNIFIEPEKFKLLHQNPYAFALCGFLAATQGFDANFMVADGLRELLGTDGWPLRALPAARKQLLNWNIIECVRPRAPGRPALYRWVVPDE